ncbi:MAG: HAD family phosphatase [Verrucomicrobiota bacterium]
MSGVKPVSEIRGVVFDMDGLLLDTEAIFKGAWQYAAKICGYQLSDEMFLQFIGRSATDTDELMVTIFGQEFVPRHFREVADRYAADFEEKHGLPVKPGVHRLLDFCHRRGWPCGVASSTHAREVERRLRSSELWHEFDAVTCGDQVVNGKPHPEIYQTAVGKLGVAAEQCLALEDSHAGVRAAHRAGMTVFMVPDLLPVTEEMRATADRIFDGLDDALAFLKTELSATAN